ncbi:GAF domain-containing SpoIIE family protein phosphatase [Algoriphagus sp. CAU 1675]|uniref:GAF domain-containing SpoIIE family protein phosphatase n=1 Tax=Algoriphagus sp. CAU 1675 TaxID=3032597 RepID=UPI0023DB848B|nr:GAF domain-containing SpoIIE family protein phosphatase [Algoriphagus sp. CAU 1675]MDF2158887.1 SpoIIE family protein phosphatase [Algoriphagus sp. CAU 1675]
MPKLPNLNIGKLSFLLAILVWLALLFVDLVRLFGTINEIDSGIAQEFTWILEILFFLTVYWFYNYSISRNTQNDFLNLIWRAASTGIFASGSMILIDLFYQVLGDSKLGQEPFLKNFFYHIHFALVTAFLISASILWKNLILYQRSKKVVKQWQTFEFAQLLAMFFIFFNQNTFDYSFIFGMVLLSGLGLILSANLKWIPYLTFKEKWKSLLFLFLILLSTGFLFIQTFSYSSQQQTYPVNLMDNLFLIILFVFVFVYALFSFLVTLFNLPTSSVFEQKLTEAINFQRLSQSIKPEESEEQVLDILVDSCMSASYADGAWLELQHESSHTEISNLRFLEQDTLEELRKVINSHKQVTEWESEEKPENLGLLAIRLAHPKFESALIAPLVVNKEIIGKMILCKEVKEGFNKEMTNIISTFVRQACIAVENHRLLNQAIQNERYQEELKIAQRVQKSLLPTRLDHNKAFEITAYSNAADEVGGDYYDTYQLDEDRFVLVMGDVSGKGTSAAFHMSQMKGIFQSLIQLGLSPGEFMIQANSALSRCLEKNHFITASIFIINTKEQTICHSRAGHLPTLLHHHLSGKAEFLMPDGLGLGILRNMQYENHVEEMTFSYQSGDILVLYTDGIVEAKNQNSQQFGTGLIQSIVEAHSQLSPKEIQLKLIDSLHEFVGGDGMIDDDYSLMVVKFT